MTKASAGRRERKMMEKALDESYAAEVKVVIKQMPDGKIILHIDSKDGKVKARMAGSPQLMAKLRLPNGDGMHEATTQFWTALIMPRMRHIDLQQRMPTEFHW